MKYWWLFLLVLATALYLNRGYAHIYSTIHSGGFANPPTDYEITLGSASEKTINFVALGDSLSAGVGATNSTATLPYILAQKLAQDKQSTVHLLNLAVPGAKAIDVLKNQAPRVTQIKPDLVLLFIGVNDIHGFTALTEYQKNLQEIVSIVKNSGAKLVIINLPQIGTNQLYWPPYKTFFNWQTRRYNKALNASLLPLGQTVVDIFMPTYQKSNNILNFYCRDQFHPADAGYKFWSDIIYAHINT